MTYIGQYHIFRLNATHVFMGGGFLTAHKATDPVQEQVQQEYSYDYYGYQDYDSGVPQTKQVDQVRQENLQANEASGLSPNPNDTFGGAIQTNKTWMYDGSSWSPKAEMKIARDRPACSIINMPDGKV